MNWLVLVATDPDIRSGACLAGCWVSDVCWLSSSIWLAAFLDGLFIQRVVFDAEEVLGLEHTQDLGEGSYYSAWDDFSYILLLLSFSVLQHICWGWWQSLKCRISEWRPKREHFSGSRNKSKDEGMLDRIMLLCIPMLKYFAIPCMYKYCMLNTEKC